jgi:hypothetical protein
MKFNLNSFSQHCCKISECEMHRTHYTHEVPKKHTKFWLRNATKENYLEEIAVFERDNMQMKKRVVNMWIRFGTAFSGAQPSSSIIKRISLARSPPPNPPRALQPMFSFVPLCIEIPQSHTIRHTVGLLWTSDQPVAEASTYTRRHNIQTQETNIHALSGTRTHDPSNQQAASPVQ